MTQILKRSATIVALLALALVGLAACQTATSPTSTTRTTSESQPTPAAAPLVEDTQRPGPGRPYAAPDLSRLGANGEVQFINSFATW